MRWGAAPPEPSAIATFLLGSGSLLLRRTRKGKQS